MSCYFIVSVFINNKEDIAKYKEYIDEVKPIVDKFGGKYLVRTENISALNEKWKPDRIIIIEFPSRKELDDCFASYEYQMIKSKRENSVDSRAVIAEGMINNENM